ncbi:hypothetical protein SK128_010349, partial [Halocaridina rubra]
GETLFNAKNRTQVLPSWGEKLSEAHRTSFEEEQVEQRLKDHHALISELRVTRKDQLATGRWIEKSNMVQLIQQTGTFWDHMGVETDIGRCLYPEEALYLTEMGELEINYQGMPLSVQSAQAVMLSDRHHLNCYLVYAHLSRSGCKVVKHQTHLTYTKYEKQIRLDQHQAKKKKNKLKLKSDNDEVLEIVYESTAKGDSKKVIPSCGKELINLEASSDMDNALSDFYKTLGNEAKPPPGMHEKPSNIFDITHPPILNKEENRTTHADDKSDLYEKKKKEYLDMFPSMLGTRVQIIHVEDTSLYPKDSVPSKKVYRVNLDILNYFSKYKDEEGQNVSSHHLNNRWERGSGHYRGSRGNNQNRRGNFGRHWDAECNDDAWDGRRHMHRQNVNHSGNSDLSYSSNSDMFYSRVDNNRGRILEKGRMLEERRHDDRNRLWGREMPDRWDERRRENRMITWEEGRMEDNRLWDEKRGEDGDRTWQMGRSENRNVWNEGRREDGHRVWEKGYNDGRNIWEGRREDRDRVWEEEKYNDRRKTWEERNHDGRSNYDKSCDFTRATKRKYDDDDHTSFSGCNYNVGNDQCSNYHNDRYRHMDKCNNYSYQCGDRSGRLQEEYKRDDRASVSTKEDVLVSAEEPSVNLKIPPPWKTKRRNRRKDNRPATYPSYLVKLPVPVYSWKEYKNIVNSMSEDNMLTRGTGATLWMGATIPMIKPAMATSVQKVLEKCSLEITRNESQQKQPSLPQELQLDIHFDAYLSNAPYRKSSPPIPSKRITVIRDGVVPTLGQIQEVAKRFTDEAPVVSAVVVNGEVRLYSLSPCTLHPPQPS